HERPQKGRYRQFHQIGVETFGVPGPDIDVELILLSARLWQALGLGGLRLEVNTLGTPAARAAYRTNLVDYLRSRVGELDEDSRRRLDTNPLRVLDSKNREMQDVIRAAPSLLDYLDEASRAHFDGLQELLNRAGLSYVVNPRLVRGLDYYTRTVFEWLTDRLGAQSAVCAGGRYDGLVELLGGKPTPAIGFAVGLERLVELLVQTAARATDNAPQVYVVPQAQAPAAALVLAEALRDRGLRVECHLGGGSLKSQLKRADNSGARYAVLLEDADRAAVKDLRANEGQRTMALADADQEELEKLKAWWKNYGGALLIGVLLGLALLFGNKYWTQYKEQQRVAASELYEQMLQQVKESKTGDARASGEKLIGEYARTPYAGMAALMLARLSFEANDAAGARRRLEWAEAHALDPAVAHAARLRLGRLYVAGGEYDAALALASKGGPGFEAEYLELKGDAYL